MAPVATVISCKSANINSKVELTDMATDMASDISNHSFSIFLVRIFLAISGIKLDNDPLRYVTHYSYIVLATTVSCVQQIVLWTHEGDFYIRCVIINNLIHSGNFLLTWFIIYSNRATLKLLLTRVKAGVYHYPPGMREYARRRKCEPPILTLKVFFVATLGLYLLILFVPMAYFLSGDRAPTYQNLIYPAWFPWRMDTKRRYLCTYLLQMFTAYPICFMVFNILFLFYFVLVIKDQSSVLTFVMRKIKADQLSQAEWRISEVPNSFVSRSVRAEDMKLPLTECVKHHRAIIE